MNADYSPMIAEKQVVIVEAATRKALKRIPMEGLPLGIQMAPDGKRVFVACAQAGTVAAIDLETLAIVATVETGKGPDGLAYAVVKNWCGETPMHADASPMNADPAQKPRTTRRKRI